MVRPLRAGRSAYLGRHIHEISHARAGYRAGNRKRKIDIGRWFGRFRRVGTTPAVAGFGSTDSGNGRGRQPNFFRRRGRIHCGLAGEVVSHIVAHRKPAAQDKQA